MDLVKIENAAKNAFESVYGTSPNIDEQRLANEIAHAIKKAIEEYDRQH